MLTEVYADPGDGSGKFKKVNSKKTLEFTDKGIVKSSNGNLCRIDINSTSNETSPFEIKVMYGAKSVINIEKCNSILSFEKKGNELTLYYACIEGCGEKFVRIK